MVPQGRQLVLSLEQSVPATAVKPFSFSTIGGYIDYIAIGVSASGAGKFLRQPLFALLIFLRRGIWPGHVWGYCGTLIIHFLFQKPRQAIFHSRTMSLKPYVKCTLVQNNLGRWLVRFILH